MKKRTKFLFLRATVILAFTILAGRLWYVQVVMGSYYKTQGNISKIRSIPVQANRGIIFDNQGKQLVWNAPVWNIDVVPHGVPSTKPWTMYRLLSRVLGGTPTPAAIAKVVSQGQWQPYKALLVKHGVPTNRALIVMQYHNMLPGIRVDPTIVRHYRMDPGVFSLTHILGYAGVITAPAYKQARQQYPHEHVSMNDLSGKDGIEQQYDAYLHGVNGNQQVEVDAGERPVRVLRRGPVTPGDSIYLTINWNFEHQVASDLQAALSKFSLRQGVAVVEDVNTGKVLAMVSLPGFDDNWFSGGISYARYQSLRADPASPLQNLATQGLYPPGSTFKLATAAAALSTGVVNPDTTYDDTGKIVLPGGQIYYGWKASGLGPVDVTSAIEQSSDIYFYTVAGGNPTVSPDPPHVGADRLQYYAHLFGLGAKTGIDLPNEQTGFIPSAKWYNRLPPTKYLKNPGDIWTIGDTYNMAIGQGQDEVTPLQIANYTSMVANGGTLYKPGIVEKIVGRVIPGKGAVKRSRVVQQFVPSMIRRNAISADYLSIIRHGMYLGAHDGFTGTSYEAYDPRIAIAGKTGTAEVLNKPPHAWWTGFAPYDNPKIAVTVLIPSANAEGAEIAAPIGHKIIEDYFHLKPLRNLLNANGAENTDGSHGGWLDDVQQALVGGGAGSQ